MNTKLNISASTIARTAVLGLALTNQLLSAAGKPVLPIESENLEQLITSGLTVAASLWAWWKNNSFTQEALHADVVLNDLKNQK
ncbi:MAG: phage holin [Faecalibacterium sp.]